MTNAKTQQHSPVDLNKQEVQQKNADCLLLIAKLLCSATDALELTVNDQHTLGELLISSKT